jgi:ubiquinone/menaquinone biosynthesis C-methylase UbiE
MIPPDEALRQQDAARFQDQSVVDRYHLRPAYPPEVFTRLQELMVDEPRAVLDVGCGPGPIALGLLDVAERIDAVDLSPQMLALARSLPGGQSPQIRWLLGRAEEVALDPPYALITAGRSLHWMDWNVVLPRFARLLTPHGVLAMVQTREQHSPWDQELRDMSRRYAARTGIWHWEMIEQLERAHLFQRLGDHTTAPMTQRQSIEEYIGRQHSRSGFSLDKMPVEQARRFDAEARALLSPFAVQDVLTLEIVGHIIWGKPLSGQAGQEEA